MIGKTLAHYRVTEKIGAGGMGEVYRATDTKLGRDVALKILPDAFARDGERMARFRREAQLLAQLNHANIAAIYGLESEGGVSALALELVEGPTLDDRIRAGTIPAREAMVIARGIAEAIESAHESGIVHRDLKPANVKFTANGQVKVLDFGLAKAFEGDSGVSSPGSGVDSPTIAPAFTSPVITGALTGANVILGTAAYMSPEQARGHSVDKRSDIWSFGVVCMEMLTGRRLFEGETVSDTLAAVLKTDPDWDGLPSGTPEPLRRLLMRCLQRDPRQRLRDIGEARVRLEEWTRDPDSLVMAVPAGKAPPSRRGRVLAPWLVAAAFAATAAFLGLERSGPREAPRIRTAIRLPSQAELSLNSGVVIQLSPDGETLAYRTWDGIRLRRLDSLGTKLLKDTRETLQFTFSPDGRWIAFIQNGRMRRVNVEGGAPVDICETGLVARGLAWVEPETIVFTPDFVGGLSAMSLLTGEIRAVTTVDESTGERSHRWPTAMGDGRSILFLCQYHNRDYDDGEVRMLTLGEGSATTVYRGGASPRYAASGHLLFARDQTVFAVPFDPKTRRTEGLAVPVLSDVWARVNDQEADDGSAQFDVSSHGVLVYQTEPSDHTTRVQAVDVVTRETRFVTEPGLIVALVASPDGRRIAYRESGQIHFLELETDASTQITFDDTQLRIGAWSADSKVFYWERAAGDSSILMSRAVDGSAAREVRRMKASFGRPSSVSPDGRYVLMNRWLDTQIANWGIQILDLDDPQSQPAMFIDEEGVQSGAQFSPDGRWITYRSNDTIYLRAFPYTGARWLVTGDREFVNHEWISDGSGILLHDGSGTYRVPIDLSGVAPRVGELDPLVPLSVVPGSQANAQSTFSPDGSTIYFLKRHVEDEAAEPSIVLVTDWLAELQELAPH